MKIYIIKGNNCEDYEDYYEWIEKDVYLVKENAEKELNRLRSEATRDYKKDRWNKRAYKIEEYDIKDYNEVIKNEDLV